MDIAEVTSGEIEEYCEGHGGIHQLSKGNFLDLWQVWLMLMRKHDEKPKVKNTCTENCIVPE